MRPKSSRAQLLIRVQREGEMGAQRERDGERTVDKITVQ